MADVSTRPPAATVAEAALAVPGVAGLQPRLAHRLAAAASPALPQSAAHPLPPASGVRVDRTPDGTGWHVEVRCVLTEGHRAVDTARHVHDRVRSAVVSHLTAHDEPGTVTVTVTVTRVATRASG
ncbi:hypothetical protein AB0C59_21275 [Streptomyces sp. NPDC048664]|uniref:hypothetical protein n=1 Tax=Streptomyces sp. NPDC048664 TaxID=3154505 RepID=UPI003421D0AC